MGKKILAIMFLVGLALFVITAASLLSGTINFTPDNMLMLLVPISIGIFLMLLSGSKLLRRFDTYLDKD